MDMTDYTSPESSLADCLALEYILLGDLRDLLEEADADDQTIRWITAVLDALLETMPCEIELKSRGGYMQPVLDQFPNWAVQIWDLAREKQELFDKLRELRQQLHSPNAFTILVGVVRQDLQEWMTLWTAHSRHERRLIQNAFTLDVGCGD